MSIKTEDFNPSLNYTISASTTSANQVIAQPTAPYGYRRIRIFNNAADIAFVTWGSASQTAVQDTVNCVQVGAGAIETFDMGSAYTNVGVILIAAASAGKVYVSIGS